MRSQRVDKKTGSEGVVPKLSFKYVSLYEADQNAAADLAEADQNAAADLAEADQNAAAGLPETDQNAAAGLPETDHNADAGAPESADLPEADQIAAAGLPETDHNADARAPESDHADAGVPEADPAAGVPEADQNATAGAAESDHNAAASAPEADAGPEAEGGLRERIFAVFSFYNSTVVLLVILNVVGLYFMFKEGASEDERVLNSKWVSGCSVLMIVLFMLNLFVKPHPNGCGYNTGMIALMLACIIAVFCFGALRAYGDPSVSKVLKVLYAIGEVCAVLAQDGLFLGHLHFTLEAADHEVE